MVRERKDILTVTVDPASINALDLLARDFEGNRSMMVRRLIRSEAERRGILPLPSAPKVRTSEGVRP
jgi:hypothetical protein